MKNLYARITIVGGLLLALVVVSFGLDPILGLIPSERFLALVGEAPAKKVKEVTYDEEVAQWLLEVRVRQLVPAAQNLLGTLDLTGRCDFSQCPESNPLCKYRPELSASQQTYCEKYLKKHLRGFLEHAKGGKTPVHAISEKFGSLTNPARTVASIDGAVEFSTPILKKSKARRLEVVYFMAKPMWQKLFDPYVGFNLEPGKQVPEFDGDADLLLSALALSLALEADKDNFGPLSVSDWEGTGNFTQMEYDLVYASLPSTLVNPRRSIPRRLVMQVNLKLGDQVGDEAGLVWKVPGGESYWARYWYDYGLYRLHIVKIDAAGEQTVLADGGQDIKQSGGTLKMEIDPQRIRATLGNMKAESDDTSLKGEGYVGVRATRASLDWFWAEDLSPKP